MTTPLDNSGDEPEGYSPGAAVTDTEAVYGSPVAPSPGSPGSMQGQQAAQASVKDTAGTAVAGIDAAMPGGSVTDTIPWSGSGQLGGMTGPGPLQGNSGYAVSGVNPSQYGFPAGSPDTEGAYGGPKPTNVPTPANPYAWLPSTTALTSTLDTTISGGSNLVPAEFPSPPAYRAPSAYVSASVKDTSLTDVLGNQLVASPLTDAAYAGQNVDTSYIGSPSAPAPLSQQTDTFTATAITTPYYLSQQGVITTTIVLKDTTRSTTLVAGTDYTLTTALNGPNTAAYFTLTAGTNYTAGDTVTAAYSYGSPQYFDSNLPAAQSLTQTDTLYLSQAPAQLLAWGVTTVAGSITVFDVTANASLTFNTDYTVTKITAPYTPGGTYSETPLITYAIAWKPTSAVAKPGDVITATYAYATSVPGAPAVGAGTSQTDAIASFTATPSALSKNGIVTPPAALSVLDTTNGKTLVLNLDYTVTVTGTGSTLTYSIARLAGSTNSTSGDHASVTYSYGNAAYFTAGPVVAVNGGVQVPFGAPSGTTEVDYYLVQSTDLGTQFVPASGEPVNYGQRGPGGGSVFGEPLYQSDQLTFLTSALAAPAGLTVTPTGTTGAVTYGYRVAAVTLTGTTLAGAEVTTATGNAVLSGTNYNALSWNAVPGAAGYQVYGRTAGAELLMTPTPLTVTTFRDTGAVTPAGALPAANTTVPTLSRTGVTTPPGQLIVRDLTSTQNDPLTPDAQVLIYNYDYTVTQVANGPWTTYQIQRLTTSVNSALGDTIAVGYWWNTMGAVPLSSIADTVIAASSVATLSKADVAIPLRNLIVYDTTISKALAYGADFTAAYTGEGPVQTVKISLITAGPAGAGAADHLTVYYLYGQVLSTVFTQGLRTNDVPIYKPSGAAYPNTGYQFSVAAGNRAGLGPFSNWSDFAAPLNFNAPQPGSQGSITSGPGYIDPANSVNPIYLPNGTVKAGTGLGM